MDASRTHNWSALMPEGQKFPSQLAERFQIRMPDGLRDRLRLAAERNKRSMNAEILHRLAWTFEQHPGLEQHLAFRGPEPESLEEYGFATYPDHDGSAKEAVEKVADALQGLPASATPSAMERVLQQLADVERKLDDLRDSVGKKV
jgi:plasmid stability protein